MEMFKCKVIRTDDYSPENPFPERFKLNSEWYVSISTGGMYYLDGRYFTSNEFNHYFEIVK